MMNCQYCGESFIGRSNQLYHYKCKVKHNNSVKKAKEERRRKQLAAIEHNYSIINAFATDEGAMHLEKQTMLSLGYDFNAITRFFVDGNTMFCFVFEFMFILKDHSDYVIIYRTDQDNDTEDFTN